jgi:predicted lipoprotein with Yx(FWY)xxD motif
MLPYAIRKEIMKKGPVIGVIIVIIIVVAGGTIALSHKKSTPVTSTSANTTTTSDAVIVTKTSSTLGQYLATANGQALYTYGGDSSGVSKCSGSCLASWPAYQDKGATTGLPTGIGTITRTDNSDKQYTYNGMPLYTFVGDSNGAVTGNGVSNFSVAKPAATSSSAPVTSTPAPATSTPASSSSSSSSW